MLDTRIAAGGKGQTGHPSVPPAQLPQRHTPAQAAFRAPWLWPEVEARREGGCQVPGLERTSRGVGLVSRV